MTVILTSFLPTTLGAWAACVAALASPVAVFFGIRNKQRIQEVHVLVNSNLTQIKADLAAVTSERDTMIEERGNESEH